MSGAILVLVGLLVLSYAGTFLASARTIRGAGLPSSVEYVALGFVLGPHVLGVLGHDLVTAFEPLVQVGLGWIALVIGLDFGRTKDRRAHLGSAALGLMSCALTGSAVAAAVWFYATRLLHAPKDLDHVLLAGGTGVACAETTRHAIRWVAERHGATGALTRMLSDFAHTDDLVPLVAMAVLFSLSPVPLAHFALQPWAWVAITIGFGVVLGAMTAVHIGRELRADQTWGVLLGMSVLGVGVAARLGMSLLTVLFFMGWTTAALSRHRVALRAMVAPLERPILLPALVLAGARVDFLSAPGLAIVAAVAVAARVVAKLVFGGALALPFRASPWLGAGLLSSGALSVSVALAFAIRFPGQVGDSVLAVACVACVAGEMVGPLALRRVLRGAGEIVDTPPPSESARLAAEGGNDVSAAASPKTLGTRLTEATLLLLVFGMLFVATRAVPEVNGGLGAVAAVGFLLLAGTLASELVEAIGLPHLSGYIAAGVIAGPHVVKLLDHDVVERLSPVNTLALSLIALAGGAELKLDLVKRGLRSLSWATLVQSGVGLVGMTAVFIALRRMIPFTHGLTFGALLGIALLWGTLSVSRSPSAVLGILAQLRPRGPLTNFSLTFVMTSDVVVVVLMAAMLAVARPLIDPGALFSASAFGALGHELLGSVALGTTLGLVLATYLRLIGKHLLLVFLALGFGLTELLQYLRFDPLLTFLVAGFLVQNLTNEGEKLLHAIEKTGSVVYVVFFATAGAHLDIPLLKTLWPVALALAGARALITWMASRLASRLAHDPPVLRTWGWSSLVSQAGLTLGMSVIIEREFPTFGTPFRALAVATVALNEVAGPVLFKLALDRAGEAAKQDEPLIEPSLNAEPPVP